MELADVVWLIDSAPFGRWQEADETSPVRSARSTVRARMNTTGAIVSRLGQGSGSCLQCHRMCLFFAQRGNGCGGWIWRDSYAIAGQQVGRVVRAATHRVGSAVGCLAMGFLAACAAGDQSAPKTSAPASVGSPATAPVASEFSAVTVPTTAATTTTGVATTPAAVTTSIDPMVAVDAALRTAVALAEESWSACLIAMPNCDPGTLAVARGGDLLAGNIARTCARQATSDSTCPQVDVVLRLDRNGSPVRDVGKLEHTAWS